MHPLQLSSGDLLADRRAAYAEMLFEGGDPNAAADLMREALTLARGWAAGWFRLGEMLEIAGRAPEAEEAWRAALRLDPEDRMGAALKLGLTASANGVVTPPSAFVETLFDQYAEEFDAALVERLGYRVPELLQDALAGAACTAFAHAVDLGCGTGLMGERLRTTTSHLEGYDISAGMLREAEAKRLYDRLERRDLQTLPALSPVADLVTAADVLMYVGELERLFSRISELLLPGGHFAFSVELNEGPEDLVLRPSRRYAHSKAYVERLLAEKGFVLVSQTVATIRMDRGEAVVGLIVVARRMEAAATDHLTQASLHPRSAGQVYSNLSGIETRDR
jgi:predicted TPR repeat methyltransferase